MCSTANATRVTSSIARTRRLLRALGAALACSMTSLTAVAAEFGTDSDPTSVLNADRSLGVGTDYFIQVIIALLVVIGIIVFLSVVVRRFSMFSGTSAGPIKILSGVSLGGKDRLLLIQVGKEQLLVGTSPGNVQKVHRLQQPIDISTGDKVPGPDKAGFSSILGSVMRG